MSELKREKIYVRTKAASNRNIFYEAVENMGTMFTNVCIAWLNLPPPHTIEVKHIVVGYITHLYISWCDGVVQQSIDIEG